MPKRETAEKAAEKPGPEPERLKIDLNPNEALQRLLKAPPRRKNRAGGDKTSGEHKQPS